MSEQLILFIGYDNVVDDDDGGILEYILSRFYNTFTKNFAIW